MVVAKSLRLLIFFLLSCTFITGGCPNNRLKIELYTHPGTGRLKYCQDNGHHEGYICPEGWDDTDSYVACVHMGLPTGRK